MLSSDNYQLVIEKFLKSLQDGTLKPNDKIYSENQLARILNIPRAQVREVYAALSLLGVLYGQQGKGTFLGSGDLSQSSNILYLMTLAAGENFEDTLAVRRILETGGAYAAAQNHTEEDLEILHNYVDIMRISRDPQILTAADTAFHAHILKSSGNALLHNLFQIVVGYMARISLQHWTAVIEQSPEEQLPNYIQQHQELLSALAQGNGAALQQCLSHHFDTLAQNIEIFH